MDKKQMNFVVVVLVLSLLVNLATFGLLVRQVTVPVEPIVIVQTEEPVEPVVEPEKTVKELQNGKPFIYIGNGQGHPVIALLIQGFVDACEKYDAECKVLVRPGFEDSDFIALQEQALAMGSSGWVTSAYSPFRPLSLKAIEQGIPVTTFHTPITPEDLPGSLAWVATNITQYGKDAADAIADKIACKGKVAITQNTFNDTENEASRSFTEQMKLRCPDVVVLDPEIEGGDVPVAIAKAASILVAHPDLTAAFGTTGGSPTTWAKSLEQSGRKPGDVVVIGMDYTRVNLDLVKSGWVYALVGQPLYEETFRCVELLIDYLYGRDVSFDNYYPSPIITIDDLDKYYEYDAKVNK